MNKNKLTPVLIPGLTGLVLLAPGVHAEKDYSDYFAYDVSAVKYVETGANTQAAVVMPVVQATSQPQQAFKPPEIPAKLLFTGTQTQALQPRVIPSQVKASEVVQPAQNFRPEINRVASVQPRRTMKTPVVTTAIPATPAVAKGSGSSGYEIYADTSEPLTTATEAQPIARPVAQPIAQPLAQRPVISHASVAQAIASGDINRLNALQAQGADLQKADAQGTTYLHRAAAAGNLAVVNFLLNAGVNPNATTAKNWTPLHHAARFGHAAIVQALIKAGANQQHTNSDGFRPKQLALNTRHAQIAALLQ